MIQWIDREPTEIPVEYEVVDTRTPNYHETYWEDGKVKRIEALYGRTPPKTIIKPVDQLCDLDQGNLFVLGAFPELVFMKGENNTCLAVFSDNPNSNQVGRQIMLNPLAAVLKVADDPESAFLKLLSEGFYPNER
jgi:hypothetical protein